MNEQNKIERRVTCKKEIYSFNLTRKKDKNVR